MWYVIPFAALVVIVTLALTFKKDFVEALETRSYFRCEYDALYDPSNYWNKCGRDVYNRDMRRAELGIHSEKDIKLYGSKFNMQRMKDASKDEHEFHKKVIEYNYSIIKPYVDKSVKWFEEREMEYYNDGSYGSIAHLFWGITGYGVDSELEIHSVCSNFWKYGSLY